MTVPLATYAAVDQLLAAAREAELVTPRGIDSGGLPIYEVTLKGMAMLLWLIQEHGIP